jgi:hypothetical protein
MAGHGDLAWLHGVLELPVAATLRSPARSGYQMT